MVKTKAQEKTANEQPVTILQFKITLNQSSPSVWRRILVPADYTFFDLHVAIQGAMDWEDSHLHAFSVAQKGSAQSIAIAYPNPESDGFDEPQLDERKEKIADYFGKIIKQCVYTYDFGDSWDHVILFEKELSADPNKTYPLCIAGENACPPEDCGGVGGYDNLQEVLKNPKNPGYKDMLEWLGLDSAAEFNPAAFDLREVHFEDPKKRLREYRKGFGI